jgi:hypothetical protein
MSGDYAPTMMDLRDLRRFRDPRYLRKAVEDSRVKRWLTGALVGILLLLLVFIVLGLRGPRTRVSQNSPRDVLSRQIVQKLREEPRFAGLEVLRDQNDPPGLVVSGEIPGKADLEDLRAIIDGMKSKIPIDIQAAYRPGK